MNLVQCTADRELHSFGPDYTVDDLTIEETLTFTADDGIYKSSDTVELTCEGNLSLPFPPP